MRLIWLVVAVGCLAIGALAIPDTVISQVVGVTLWGYELPNDQTLRQALNACQIDRYSTREYVLCPRRLSDHDFPKFLGDALIASEDRTFYEHHGIDKLAVVSAFATNGLRAVGLPLARRGGSSITQQLARTLFLDERDGWSRKIREAALAPRIERVLTKPEILAAYMNVVPHARGMNGFDAAARYFFGVPVNAIRLEEAALLVGMLPAPNDRDPTRNPQGALESAIRVLERMLEQDKIDEARELAAVHALTLRLRDGQLQRGHATIAKAEIRPYRDLAIAEAAHHGADVDDDYRLIVYMDPDLQGWVVDATERIAGPNQAAGVFIRPTGEVLGIAGSRDYVESSLNRAYRTRQQIGSTGKLFVLVAAYENGISPTREFPSRSLNGRGWPAEPSRLCKGRDMTLTAALTHSCNRPFTWAAWELAHRLNTVVNRFDLTPPDAPALVPLGGIETSPLKLTRAYAAVANHGRMPRIRSLIAALGRRGNVLYAPAGYSDQVMSPEIAARVRQALRSPVESGTARLADSTHAVVYGKTGTTSHDKDALFVGLTNDFVGAFWIGDDHGQGMVNVVGGGAPARAFGRITDSYYTSKTERAAPVPIANPSAGWRWLPDVLQNREYRYYGWVALIALAFATVWLQLYRHGVLSWAVRTWFGLRPPVRAIAGLFGRLTRIRLPRLRPKQPHTPSA